MSSLTSWSLPNRSTAGFTPANVHLGAVGRAHGLTEVENEKMKSKPKGVGYAHKSNQEGRVKVIRKAVDHHKSEYGFTYKKTKAYVNLFAETLPAVG
jgi:hypothetical protein